MGRPKKTTELPKWFSLEKYAGVAALEPVRLYEEIVARCFVNDCVDTRDCGALLELDCNGCGQLRELVRAEIHKKGVVDFSKGRVAEALPGLAAHRNRSSDIPCFRPLTLHEFRRAEERLKSVLESCPESVQERDEWGNCLDLRLPLFGISGQIHLMLELPKTDNELKKEFIALLPKLRKRFPSSPFSGGRRSAGVRKNKQFFPDDLSKERGLPSGEDVQEVLPLLDLRDAVSISWPQMASTLGFDDERKARDIFERAKSMMVVAFLNRWRARLA